MQAKKTTNNMDDSEYDLKFLLNRGYRKTIALNFVANKHLLNRNERNYLVRKVFSDETISIRRDKKMDIPDITGNPVLIDGYNVLITVEIICNKEYDSLILCDDGVVRDVKAVFGGYKINNSTVSAIKSIASTLKPHKPKSINFIYDSPVSKSGELAKLTGKILKDLEVSGSADTNKNVDFALVNLSKKPGGIVATSDGAVIDRVDRFIDIPHEICRNKKIHQKELKLKNNE